MGFRLGVINKMDKVEFIGTPSGDGECFCWEVDKETFKKITGVNPSVFDYVDVEWERNEQGDIIWKTKGDCIKLYPGNIFKNKYVFNNKGEIIEVIKPKKMRIKIEFEEIE